MAYNARQYEPAEAFFGAADANIIHDMDKKRCQAYDLYDGIYLNWPNSIKLVLRGANSLPIYIPSGRKIVNTTDRFLGKNIDYYVEPEGLDGNPADATALAEVEKYFEALYDRETVRSKIASSKKWGLARGDAVLLVTADEKKPQGSRISIHEVDPRQVFVIDGPTPNSVAGYHVTELIRDPRDDDPKTTKQICQRQTWRKEVNDAGVYTGKILYSQTFWEVGKWDDRLLTPDDMEPVRGFDLDEIEEAAMPDEIRALPIYRWQTDPPQNSSWGTSILSGLETPIFAINQSISDEDLTLAMRGLGMYVTNAAPPIDESGQILSWNVGPGQVIELSAEQEFNNVAGVQDISPYVDHMTFVDDKGISESSGLPGVAIGRVDVTVAESGISLKLQLDPLLAANSDRELALVTTLNQMHYDLVSMWIPAFEKWDTMGVIVSVVFEDPMPVNEQQEIQDMVLLWTSDLILTEMAVEKLSKMGWRYPAGMSTDEIVAALEEQTTRKTKAIDPYGGQMQGGEGEFGDENENTTRTVEL